jgi:hypothetical protein
VDFRAAAATSVAAAPAPDIEQFPLKLFHVSQTVCSREPLFRTLPSTAFFSPFFSPAASAISCGFSTEIVAEKVDGISTVILHGKHVQIVWKICGDCEETHRFRPVQKPADNLRESGGTLAENLQILTRTACA